jgi:deoxycytidylate deaminase
MKTDNYLALCLEQAVKSPLRYRHGSIIVRGGKVIGQGYNDYRPGFDGGALKTGRLPLRSSNNPSVVELKKKLKVKEKLCGSDEETKTFTPFENIVGGGKLANTPLSMHSEMMAIHSALSASSTQASNVVSSEKPRFKLPGDSKQKSRLRREALQSYVEVVCQSALAQSTAASCHTQSDVQEWLFETGTSRSNTTSHASLRGERTGYGLAQMEQYGETPREGEAPSSSQTWQQVPWWTTQTPRFTTCT